MKWTIVTMLVAAVLILVVGGVLYASPPDTAIDAGDDIKIKVKTQNTPEGVLVIERIFDHGKCNFDAFYSRESGPGELWIYNQELITSETFEKEANIRVKVTEGVGDWNVYYARWPRQDVESARICGLSFTTCIGHGGADKGDIYVFHLKKEEALVVGTNFDPNWGCGRVVVYFK